jgi:hypothetical protein
MANDEKLARLLKAARNLHNLFRERKREREREKD